MSSQGWAAAIQGLQQGLDKGLDAKREREKLLLEAALKQRQLELEQQKIDQEKSLKTIDPSIFFEDKSQVISELNQDTGYGPTAPGEATGLGALNKLQDGLPKVKTLRPGLPGVLDVYKDQKIAPIEGLKAILDISGKDSDRLAVAKMQEEGKNTRAAEGRALQKELRMAGLSGQQAAKLEGILGKDITPLSTRLAELQGRVNFMGDVSPDAFPSATARNLAKVPLVGGLVAESLSTNDQMANLQLAKDVLNQLRHARYGGALTGTEKVESELESGITLKDPQRVAQALRTISEIKDARVKNLRGAFPLGAQQMEGFGADPVESYLTNSGNDNQNKKVVNGAVFLKINGKWVEQ